MRACFFVFFSSCCFKTKRITVGPDPFDDILSYWSLPASCGTWFSRAHVGPLLWIPLSRLWRCRNWLGGLYVGESNHPRVSERGCELDVATIHSTVSRCQDALFSAPSNEAYAGLFSASRFIQLGMKPDNRPPSRETLHEDDLHSTG